MKKIFLIMLIVFVVAIGNITWAASFLDVSDSDRQAVDTLATLGVLTGYPDGTFQGGNTITRAEFCAATIRLIGEDATAEAVDTIFPDVKADFWSGVHGSGMIQKAADLGIIKGYPNGKFYPDQTVTYAEAVTMIVRAIGYDKDAKGDFPKGYLSVAASKGITTGITMGNDDGATRSLVAKLLYNSLSATWGR